MIAPTLTMSVAVVSFNTRDVLAKCLASVMTTRPERVVVVDNGSTDGTTELLRAEFPEIHLISQERNLGYGAAANLAVSACDSAAVLLLNSDTIVAADALVSLGRYLADHPHVGVVGPRLVNADGVLQRSTFPFPSASDTAVGETGLHLLIRRVPGIRESLLRTWSHDAPRRVPWVVGAALAIRRSAFEAVGGFDEAFFMYSEEVDLCRRLSMASFETHFAPVTTIVHIGGASTRQSAESMRYASRRKYLLRHESRARAARTLRILEAIVFARRVRDAVLLRLVRDPARRRRLRTSLASQKFLLADRTLWKP